MLSFLQKEGVATDFIVRKPGRRTSAVILGIEPPERFPLVYYRDNDADIALNTGSHTFRALAADSTPGGPYDDLQNTLTHELGHALMFRRFGRDAHIVLYAMGGLAIEGRPQGFGSPWSFDCQPAK